MAARLTLTEIEKIRKLKAQGKSNRVIAGLVGRDSTTVARVVCSGCNGTRVEHIARCGKK